MAKVLSFLVLLIVLFFGIKLALAAMSYLAVAGSIAILGCFAVGVFTVTRFVFKARK